MVLDTKSSEIHEGFMKILKISCKRTPVNILNEWSKALSTNAVKRMDLMALLKKELPSNI